MEKHLCESCAKQNGCKHWENIKTQPKLTLVGCEHYKKAKPEDKK